MNTDKQEKFIEHYCRTGNATQSAIYAGYSEKGAVQAGHRLKRQFSDQIQERVKRMVQDMVPASLSAIQALIDQGERELNQWKRQRLQISNLCLMRRFRGV